MEAVFVVTGQSGGVVAFTAGQIDSDRMIVLFTQFLQAVFEKAITAAAQETGAGQNAFFGIAMTAAAGKRQIQIALFGIIKGMTAGTDGSAAISDQFFLAYRTA